MQPVVQNMLRGTSGTVLLVGASNSGKTHTLTGTVNKGILPRTVNRIMQTVTPFIGQMDTKTFDNRQAAAIMATEHEYFRDNVPERSFLRASVYLIYKDNIYDLLTTCPPKHKTAKIETYIDQDTYEVQTRLTGLTERFISSKEYFNSLLSEAYHEISNL